MIYSDDDIDVLARTLYGEARGEPDDGKEAVAHVVVNRLRTGRYGRSIVQVCQRPRQFSCWNIGDPNRSLIENIEADESAVFSQCLDIAKRVLRGAPDNTRGSTHYCTVNSHPYWAKDHTPVAIIGNHKFYNDIR